MYGLGITPSKTSAARSRQHDRGDRAELLASLDVVEALQHLPVRRAGEQAAVAERARAVLAAPLEPADDPVGGEHRGRRVGEVVGSLEGHAGGAQARRDLVVAQPRRAPPWPSARSRPPSAQRELQCGAERGAGVARRRLHPDVARTAPRRRAAPLATQFRATPPAMRERRGRPSASCTHWARLENHLLERVCTDAAERGVGVGQCAALARRRDERRPVDRRRRGSRRLRRA